MTHKAVVLALTWLVMVLPTSFVLAEASSALRVPGEVDVVRLWEDVLEHADRDAIYAGYRRLDTLWPKDGEVDIEVCTAQRQQLDADLRVNPVGVALWWVSSLCAQAIGDEARAERDVGAFSALVRHAMASLRPDRLQAVPIRVLSEYDVYAIVEVSGQMLLYNYYDTTRWGRHLPLHVSLWDAQTQRERLLVFDMLEPMVRLSRDKPESESPGFRFVLADALIDALGRQAGTPGESGRVLLEALGQSTAESRATALVEASDRGLSGVVLAMGRVCLADPTRGCADAAVDALLPLAERRVAHALVLLAVANSLGTGGIDMDAEAANVLLDTADRELGAALGSQLFLAMIIDDELPLHIDVRARLRRLAAADDLLAAQLVVYQGIVDPGHEVTARELAQLRRAAADGPGDLAFAYARLGALDPAERVRWLQRAAESGVRPAQEQLAEAFFDALGVARDPEQGERWLVRAAHDGSIGAIQRVASSLQARKEGRRAQWWLESLIWLGEQDAAGDWPGFRGAAYDYAEMTARGRDGAQRNPAEAVRVLRQYVDEPEAVGERQLLSELLINGHGGGGAGDRAAAVRWLRVDIARGNARSMGLLGSAALNGYIPAGVVADAGALLRAAAQGGDLSAMSELAMAIYAQRVVATRPDEVHYWLGKAAGAGSRMARNNLAWVLCVAADPALRDPEAGFHHAKVLAREPDLPPGFIDTLAACDTANGKPGRAVQRQKQAIALLKQRGADPEEIERYREHLAMFQRGESVRESFD